MLPRALDDGLVLRLARRDETGLIDDLMKASIRAIFPAFYDDVQTASSVRYIGAVDAVLVDDGTYFVIDVPDGQLVACGGWSRRDKLFTGSATQEGQVRVLDPATEPARVRAMFVHGDWTRRGLGTRILEACESEAKAEGFRRLALMATMPGLQLYLRYGFVDLGHEPIVLPDGVAIAGARMEMRIAE
ncbi:MAG TPA: GNAT family N-acetyltransferase [Candidatus Limnocylindrales bacterium]|nr:GNAT family N-acetyltransferase [Candidatus Limnocylindrales bacterium]